MDAPAGATQEEGHTGFLHLPSAVLALIFIARRVQPSVSLVNRQVELHFQHHSRVWINRVWLPRSAEQETCFLPSPSSRLKVWHCETDSAISSRVSLLIIHSQAAYDTFSRDSSRFLQRRPQMYRQPQSGQPLLYIIRSRSCVPKASTAENPPA